MTKQESNREIIIIGSILVLSILTLWVNAGFKNPFNQTIRIHIDHEQKTTSGFIGILHVFLFLTYIIYSIRQVKSNFQNQLINWISNINLFLLIVIVLLNLLDFSAASRCGYIESDQTIRNNIIITLLLFAIGLIGQLIYASYRTGKNAG
ncbi:MAG: hypothetical protein ACHQF2_09120 [Flavobacteriales bacterium]